MKRTYEFAQQMGTAICPLDGDRFVEIPVFPGILKHPRPSELCSLLTSQDVARKYTSEALRMAAWPILRAFPKWWLVQCLESATLSESRRRALLFMLDG